MKLTIRNKEELGKHLDKVNGIIASSNTQAVLDNICLEICDGYLTIRATDMEVSIETSLQLEEKSEAGGITVPAKSFCDIIKTLPGDTKIHMQAKENNWILIRCGNSKFNLAGRNVEEYPVLPKFSQHNFHSVDMDSFSDMVNYTSFAVSSDETRYQMSGVYLGSLPKSKENLDSYMVATDGHRLAYCEKKLFTKEDSFLNKRKEGFIIPKKGIKKVRELLGNNSAELMVAWESNHLIFKVDQTYVLIRLIEGKYPDHNRILPKETITTFKVGTKELLESIKRISCVTNNDSIGTKIRLTKNKLNMFTNNPSLGEGNVELKVDYDDEDIEIAFNVKYLEESIANIKEEVVDVFFDTYNKPGVIRVPKANYVSVLMPMRI